MKGEPNNLSYIYITYLIAQNLGLFIACGTDEPRSQCCSEIFKYKTKSVVFI